MNTPNQPATAADFAAYPNAAELAAAHNAQAGYTSAPAAPPSGPVPTSEPVSASAVTPSPEAIEARIAKRAESGLRLTSAEASEQLRMEAVMDSIKDRGTRSLQKEWDQGAADEARTMADKLNGLAEAEMQPAKNPWDYRWPADPSADVEAINRDHKTREAMLAIGAPEALGTSLGTTKFQFRNATEEQKQAARAATYSAMQQIWGGDFARRQQGLEQFAVQVGRNPDLAHLIEFADLDFQNIRALSNFVELRRKG